MSDFKAKIEAFVSKYLRGFEVEDAGRKYVHDSVWGGIELKPHEHALIDTPLLQRLRQLHQTGCVYATYPTARHSRFEHTLGVAHLAGRIVETLRKRYPPDVVPAESEQRVRMAALLHDVGHSAFSHSTEEIYSQLEDIKGLTGAGGEFADKGAGEVLSYLIVTSSAFRTYFDGLKKRFTDLRIDNVDEFAPLILGRSVTKKLQFEADIISGPFDADKLDYFPRDGKAAGLSLTLDTDRLLSCLELADIAPTYFIPESPDKEKRKTIVVNRGGFNPLQQLLFARATLFSTVYHHHKVRACDCMVKAAFEAFRNDKTPFKRTSGLPDGLNLDSAADYLHITDLDFFAEAHRHPEESKLHQLIHDLLYRRLLKRSLIISAHTIVGFREVQRPADEVLASYSSFLAMGSDSQRLRQFAIEIANKSGVDPAYVWCDIPKQPSFKKAGDALINLSSKAEAPRIERLAKFIPTESWVQTYQQYYSQSFIFGPINREQREDIAAVAIGLLKDRFGLDLNAHASPHDIRKGTLDEVATEDPSLGQLKSSPTG